MYGRQQDIQSQIYSRYPAMRPPPAAAYPRYTGPTGVTRTAGVYGGIPGRYPSAAGASYFPRPSCPADRPDLDPISMTCRSCFAPQVWDPRTMQCRACAQGEMYDAMSRSCVPRQQIPTVSMASLAPPMSVTAGARRPPPVQVQVQAPAFAQQRPYPTYPTPTQVQGTPYARPPPSRVTRQFQPVQMPVPGAELPTRLFQPVQMPAPVATAPTRQFQPAQAAVPAAPTRRLPPPVPQREQEYPQPQIEYPQAQMEYPQPQIEPEEELPVEMMAGIPEEQLPFLPPRGLPIPPAREPRTPPAAVPVSIPPPTSRRPSLAAPLFPPSGGPTLTRVPSVPAAPPFEPFEPPSPVSAGISTVSQPSVSPTSSLAQQLQAGRGVLRHRQTCPGTQYYDPQARECKERKTCGPNEKFDINLQPVPGCRPLNSEELTAARLAERRSRIQEEEAESEEQTESWETDGFRGAGYYGYPW